MSVCLRVGMYGLLAAINGLFLALLHQEWPHAGFDLSYFLPRLIDVHLHYLSNGISVQWWSPSFGGGLPAFPNPQHTQFMLSQFLLPLTDPWTAVVLGLLLPSSLGFLLVAKFALDHLDWSLGAALLAAAVFTTNNFFLYHAFSGHLGFTTFPLVTVLPFCLHQRLRLGLAVALFALAGTAIIFTGGYTIIIVYLLTALLLTAGLALANPLSFPFARSIRVMTGGSALMVLAGAAKVCAVALFMQQFPREVSYAHSAQTWLGAWVSVPAQLLLWKPLLFLERAGWLSAENVFLRWSGSGVEDLGLSPIALLLLPVGIGVWVKHWRAGAILPLALGLAAVVWLTMEITLGRGLLWPWLKPLPILRSLHANSRFGSAFILPATLLCGLGAQTLLFRCRTRAMRSAFVLLAVALTLGSLLPFRRIMHGHWFGGFDVAGLQATWTRIRAGEQFTPVTAIADIRDDQVFDRRASNLKPYEPIFGYGYPGADFRTTLDPGPIQPPTGNAFRLHHPVALFAPESVRLPPFSLVPASQGESVDLFLQRRQPPAWPLPPIQTAANVVTIIALIVLAALFLLPVRKPLRP